MTFDGDGELTKFELNNLLKVPSPEVIRKIAERSGYLVNKDFEIIPSKWTR
jgi:hypothetical protein